MVTFTGFLYSTANSSLVDFCSIPPSPHNTTLKRSCARTLWFPLSKISRWDSPRPWCSCWASWRCGPRVCAPSPPGGSAAPQCRPLSAQGSPPEILICISFNNTQSGLIYFSSSEIWELYCSDETNHFHLIVSLKQAGDNFFQLPKLRLHSSAHRDTELLFLMLLDLAPVMLLVFL